MHRYTDWVLPYLQKQALDAQKYQGVGTNDKLAAIAKVQSLFEENAKSAGQETTVPYIIVDALEEKVVSQHTFDEAVQVTVTQVKCSYMQSYPTGEANLAMDLRYAANTESEE